MVLTSRFWKATGERAIKSAGQAAILVIGAEQVNVLTADWVTVAGFAVGGAVLSVLTSIASARVGDPDSPSLLSTDEG